MTREIDILIRKGKVYDGTGGDPVDADVAVVGDRIAEVLPAGRLKDRAKTVIEAEGLSVAPGFIDTHAHSEFTLLADNRAEGKVLQGITTEINGNCGLSSAPLLGDAAKYRETDLRELGIKERWATFGEYFRLLEERGLVINFATLAGHGNIRASVVGYDERSPEGEEEARMCGLLRNAVREGAIGLSTGLIYPPGVYAETEELIGLSRCISALLYTSHMRSEGDALIESIEETLRIGRAAGIAVHISHIKTGGRENWQKIDRAVTLLDEARSGGMSVTADRYPYTASSTDLDAVLPSWTYAGGAEAEMRRLEDEALKTRIRDEVLSEHPTDDYWKSITLSSLNRESNKWMEGRTLSDIAERVGRRPVEFLFDILLEERLRVGAIFHSMNEDNLRRFLSLPYVMIGSDSSARSSDGPTHRGKPHPRGFGTFPRFIGRYVRDEKQMSVSEAIHKATMLPAETFGLTERGQIRKGFIADLVVFDEERIIDRATFEEPFLKPEGISYVFVNGSPAVREGSQTGVMSGKILRHGR
ncbi:MAG TPA: D-aminoacylase [Thermodesulfovibrionales bacterium]|nr:D-aminoacylase [Thermodesulfovibrionales bacterium]